MGIPSLHPLDSSTSLSCNNWKMFPVIAKCPLGEVRSCAVENRCLKDGANLQEKDTLSCKESPFLFKEHFLLLGNR